MPIRHATLAIAFLVIVGIATTLATQPEKLAEQKAAAKANWKKAFDKEDPPHVETANFLVFPRGEGDNVAIGERNRKAFRQLVSVMVGIE